MEEKSQLVFVLIILIAICIWFYTKLNAEKEARNKLIRENNKLARENNQLLADNALLEAEQLKFQLQPHTLNNILANLKTIANKLNKGMDSLSETLDYILYKGNAHLVTVEDEMDFIKKYLDLNDLFISEIDSIKFTSNNVDKSSVHFKSPSIPHLISAYFIENAFKHGHLEHPEFLKIDIKLNNTVFEMSVVNKTRHKPNKTEGGLGLNNMRKRLELLHPGKHEVKNSCNESEYHSTLLIRF